MHNFGLIEATLGLQMQGRHQQDYYKRTNAGGFTQEDYNKINEKETSAEFIATYK